MEEAKLMEIKSYLKFELKIRPSEIKNLDIVKIYPQTREDWNVLYVEFGNSYQVDKVFSHTRYMTKQDHRVLRWYPRQMYARYRAVESIAYDLRIRLQMKTRVKIGRDDIQLYTRDEHSIFWRMQILPDNLPKFEITGLRLSSPPPGRPHRVQEGIALGGEAGDNDEAAAAGSVDEVISESEALPN